MTSLSRSSSTLAPTHPLSDTVVTLAAPSFFAESGTEPPTMACDPDTRTTANSITVASNAPIVSRLRIHPPPNWVVRASSRGKDPLVFHGAAPPRAIAAMRLKDDSTWFQVDMHHAESDEKAHLFKKIPLQIRASGPPRLAARQPRSCARCQS